MHLFLYAVIAAAVAGFALIYLLMRKIYQTKVTE